MLTRFLLNFVNPQCVITLPFLIRENKILTVERRGFFLLIFDKFGFDY
jgi:hypothetical protein